MNLRRLILMAMSITILVVQEMLLMVIPNVQFTTLLIVLYASLFTFKENIIMIFIYVFIDSLYMGALNPLYMIPMVIGWSLIPIAYHTVLKQTTSEVKLAVFGLIFGFLYGWTFIPFRMIELGIDEFWPYLILDLPFEMIMAVANFVTILWLFKPLHKTLAEEFKQMNLSPSINNEKSS